MQRHAPGVSKNFDANSITENMKIIVADNLGFEDCDNPLSWHFLPDSAFANAGKPFFIPDFADEFEATLSPAVRISRIGKSIAEKFASRYYAEIAPAIRFHAPGLMRELLSKGLPADRAYSFDRSIIIGAFMPVEKFREEGGFSFIKNGVASPAMDIDSFFRRADRTLALASAYNTVKMGDLIVPDAIAPCPIMIGDRLEVVYGGVPVLETAVK